MICLETVTKNRTTWSRKQVLNSSVWRFQIKFLSSLHIHKWTHFKISDTEQNQKNISQQNSLDLKAVNNLKIILGPLNIFKAVYDQVCTVDTAQDMHVHCNDQDYTAYYYC